MAERPVGLAQLDDIDAVFAALAHEARRQILLVLHVRGGELTSGELASRFDCSWPTTTRHLGVLADAGLVTVTADGRQRRYRLELDRLLGVTGSWLGAFD
ncbi:MAG: metalloregulator ArsR/SmtB family transcription factor [Acidimicrobiia bacterium]|nr:metalloregulator ArsR/SmtB family transcription factor [Acidimicrobiia bacterium]